jgi:hypothetical protein
VAVRQLHVWDSATCLTVCYYDAGSDGAHGHVHGHEASG